MKPDDPWRLTIGADWRPGGRCTFRVWAPRAEQVDLYMYGDQPRTVAMQHADGGYFTCEVEGLAAGTLYKYRLDRQREFPDPASRLQPHGVHEASAVVDPRFDWSDENWRGIRLDDFIFYELHVGTFTAEGTFAAAAQHLDELVELGVTAVEVMPVAQFPGGRNWGYDGVYPFAVQNTYGGPVELKKFVDACHQRSLAVVLDVVYNHLGPEGNYLAQYGPYFAERYRIRWGEAINFDGRGSDAVRDYFLDNVRYWVTEYHIDGLRLDAVQAIFDQSPTPILAEISQVARERSEWLGRQIHIFPESGQNDPRLTNPATEGGYGLDAEWNEDFHRALHALLTGERFGYYGDFGRIDQLATAYRQGYVWTGQHVRYRGRRHGGSPRGKQPRQFIVYAQNHDQTGNRLYGERLSVLVDFESLKLAAAAVLLSPNLPLLFMGEEYGETAPFMYFISHGDQSLIEAVRRGRRSDFGWQGEVPDPQDPAVFEQCRLHRELRHGGHHRQLWDFYRELVRLRKETTGLRNPATDRMQVEVLGNDRVLSVRRWNDGDAVLLVLNFSSDVVEVPLPASAPGSQKLLDSGDPCWGGQCASSVSQDEGAGGGLVLRPRAAVLLRI